jgi:hypothetical protein
VDGKFVDTGVFQALCAEHGVDPAPVVYQGGYSLDVVRELAAGNTTLPGDHIREGVVVRPKEERVDPKVGRVILKYIGDQYLLSKSADRDTHDT